MATRRPLWLAVWAVALVAIGLVRVASAGPGDAPLAVGTQGDARSEGAGWVTSSTIDAATTSTSVALVGGHPSTSRAATSTSTSAPLATRPASPASGSTTSTVPGAPVQGVVTTPIPGGPVPGGQPIPPYTPPDVQGHVVDSSGRALVGVCVDVGPGQHVKSDADGFFQAAKVNSFAGGWWVIVDDGCRTDPGAYWVSESLRLTGLPAAVLMVAHRSGGLTGRVVDPRGAPIAGVCLQVDGVLNGQQQNPMVLRADAEGVWHDDRLDAGDYHVRYVSVSCGSRIWLEPTDRSWEDELFEVTLGSLTTIPTMVATTRVDCEVASGPCTSTPL